MGDQLKAAKDVIMSVFELTGKALKSAGRPPDCFQLQFAVYRNYSSDKDILQHSGWESDPASLKRFCDSLEVHGGQGAGRGDRTAARDKAHRGRPLAGAARGRSRGKHYQWYRASLKCRSARSVLKRNETRRVRRPVPCGLRCFRLR